MTKEGYYWRACYDVEQNVYVAYLGFPSAMANGFAYYQITDNIFEQLTADNNTLSRNLILHGRILYKFMNERSSGAWCKEYDENWRQLCKILIEN
jgi:hypothetical protein